MKLSNQAVGSLLITLQKCLVEQTDITALLTDWNLEIRDNEIYVLNPPFVGGQEKSSNNVFLTPDDVTD